MTYAERVNDEDANIKRIYVAGPMQGAPEHGFPEFEIACAFLRSVGSMRGGYTWHVFSPHEVDNHETPETRGKTKDHWEYMRADMQLLVICDAICLLDGWSKSRGAVQELNCAIAMGLEIWRFIGSDTRFFKIS